MLNGHFLYFFISKIIAVLFMLLVNFLCLFFAVFVYFLLFTSHLLPFSWVWGLLASTSFFILFTFLLFLAFRYSIKAFAQAFNWVINIFTWLWGLLAEFIKSWHIYPSRLITFLPGNFVVRIVHIVEGHPFFSVFLFLYFLGFCSSLFFLHDEILPIQIPEHIELKRESFVEERLENFLGSLRDFPCCLMLFLGPDIHG